ncbi:hypothetical protein Tco_1254829 [Tanacetum coccineum]
MGSITSIKCVLTQEHLDAICAKYFFPEEVHPQLPSSDATMHKRPTGKVGMYTRFFDYANYHIPFSTFFVFVLTHFRILFSQLSVFGSAKVSHFEILCRVCNINPSVGLFWYFYTYNYKNGWFGFTKRPNIRACYSKNLDSVKNWNDHFFWVDEFVVPANARFGWFSGTNIVKDRAPTISEYNVKHANALIAQASPFLRFPEELLCWVGISRNYLLNKDTYPRFEYDNGEEIDLNAFIRTTDTRKVRIVERERAENERPIMTVAKYRTVTLLPTSVVRPSGELSASIEREFVRDAGGSGGGDQEIASVGGHDNFEPIVSTTDNVVAETEAPGPKRSKKKRVTRGSESTPAASHPPKRLRADYETTGGSVAGGKSPSVLNRLLQDSRLTVEQGVPALPTLPFITSSVTASPLEEGGDHTDSVTGPSLRTVGPSMRFVVLSDSSHHSGAKSADPEVDSFVRSVAPVMTTTTTVTAFVSSVAATAITPVDVGKDKDVPALSVFACSISSDKTDRTLSLFTGKSGSEFVAGSIRAGGDVDVDLQEIYILEWSVTKGFELNDGRSCANMIDHFTPPAFFKTVRGMEHEQLFAEFNMSAARNLSLSSEDNEIEELRSQLLHAKDESMEVARLRTLVSSLEAIEGSLRGEVASAKEHNGLLEQERSALKLKVTSLESIIAEKDRELSDLGTSASSLRSQNQSLVNQVHELETSSAGLREKLEMYEGSMKQLEEFQDNLMKLDWLRLMLILPGVLLMAKCLNSTEYMEALGNAFGRAIKKGMQEGLAAGIEHGQAGRCLSDLEAYNPSAEADFNFAIRDLRGMTDLQPDVGQLMVPVHHKQDKVVIRSQALSVALETCHRRVRKMERNLVERLPLLKDVFVSIDHPVSAEALAILPETSTEPPVTALITTALSTVVIRPNSGPFLLVEDYENPDLAGAVPEDVIPGPEGEGKVEGSTKGDVDDAFSQLENEVRDAVF